MMPRHIALLRAINVGGHTVTMDRLRGLFQSLGFRGVETFIASGNVVFDSPARPGAPLERRIASHLERALGYEVATFVRSPAELAAIAALRPFPGDAPGATLYIGFLPEPPAAATARRLAALATDIDSFVVRGREVYWRCRKTMGQSTVSGAMIEKALAAPTTLRRSTTVEKLAAKVAG